MDGGREEGVAGPLPEEASGSGTTISSSPPPPGPDLSASLPPPSPRLSSRVRVAFFLLGLLNNVTYVVMIAGANTISSAAVGLVFLAAVGPSLLLKLSAPHWFHLVSYSVRAAACALLASASLLVVATTRSRIPQLCGVALSSLQSGLGEASMLALAGAVGGAEPVALWSSGTGAAGVAGFAWVAGLHQALGISFPATLLAGNVFAVAWVWTFFGLLPRGAGEGGRIAYQGELGIEEGQGHPRRQERRAVAPGAGRSDASKDLRNGGGVEGGDVDDESARLLGSEGRASADPPASAARVPQVAPSSRPSLPPFLSSSSSVSVLTSSSFSAHDPSSSSFDPSRLSFGARSRLVAKLYPYTVPLFLVYFAEYAMQSGAWASIGFPPSDASSRATFYLASNWVYQAGVLVSRSSGTLWRPGLAVLWLMPALQVALLIFFVFDAVAHVLYSYALLLPLCFVVGLLGGGVYVNAFRLLSETSRSPAHREFSLGAATVADSLGIVCADVAGVLLQGCLFRANAIHGADFACGA